MRNRNEEMSGKIRRERSYSVFYVLCFLFYISKTTAYPIIVYTIGNAVINSLLSFFKITSKTLQRLPDKPW